ncbi:MAG: DUF4112 domain-containing protein [Synechococcaceae cyanobacterium RL_1_2]|nr:DUF4112 domain-containing protein [Synechococcaceae cyanobacterium RL_1_2]
MSQHQTKSLEQARFLAHLLDDSIPIPFTDFRIGLDPILGLIPAVGDYGSAIASGYLLWSAHQLGASKITLAKMGMNLLIDAMAGSVPLIGDLFDSAWQANQKNMVLLEQDLKQPAPYKSRSDRWFAIGLLVVFGLIIIGTSAFSLWGIHQVWLWAT